MIFPQGDILWTLLGQKSSPGEDDSEIIQRHPSTGSLPQIKHPGSTENL